MDNILTKYQSLWICLVLTLAIAVVFYQVYTYDFINYDDPTYVSKNPNIQAGITLEAIKWAFTTGYAANWHPLTWFSHMLDWQLFGPNPAGHHLVNLIFHIANTLLLFVVLRQMTGAVWPSAFVAALFSLHPLHVESVAWVSERKDVLSTFFWFLTMWAYVRFVRRPRVAGYLLVVVFLALGLMSKPMLVTLPFVLLLLDYWPLDRLNPRRPKAGLFVEKIPLFAMVLASCIVTYISQQKGGAVPPMELHDFPVRLANASISYLQYIVKMIWPARLAIVYPYPGPNVSFFFAIISTVFLLVITIFIFRFVANHRYLVTGWLWYLGTLVPVIGLVQVGDQAMADRYTYVTLTGLFIIITWGLPDLLEKWQYKKIVLTLSALLVISAASVCTHFQLRYWRNNLTLFQHALDITEDNYKSHLCMATSMHELGRVDETIYHCLEAIRIKPDSREAHDRLGDTLRDAGRLDEAAREYQKSLQIKPDDPNVLNALGITLGRQDKSDEAVKYFIEALRIKPDFASAHTNLGYALAIQGDLDEAAVHFVEAIRLDPGSAKAYYHLGQILVQRGETDKAIAHFSQAIRIDPNFTDARESLDLVLAEKQKLQGTENTRK